MTSKEMEARSGVARANIRYYEAEGLLTPARRKNGYRDYSEADLELLEKIKLLRRLGVSVEELKALRSGSASLRHENSVNASTQIKTTGTSRRIRLLLRLLLLPRETTAVSLLMSVRLISTHPFCCNSSASELLLSDFKRRLIPAIL